MIDYTRKESLKAYRHHQLLLTSWYKFITRLYASISITTGGTIQYSISCSRSQYQCQDNMQDGIYDCIENQHRYCRKIAQQKTQIPKQNRSRLLLLKLSQKWYQSRLEL